jgi:hypothetical protein
LDSFFIFSTALKSTVTSKALIAVTSQDQSLSTTATKDLYSYLSQRENEFVDVENGKELSQLVVRAKFKRNVGLHKYLLFTMMCVHVLISFFFDAQYPDKPILYHEDLIVHHQHPSLRDITSLIQTPTPPWPYPYQKGANTNVEASLDTIAKRDISCEPTKDKTPIGVWQMETGLPRCPQFALSWNRPRFKTPLMRSCVHPPILYPTPILSEWKDG